MAKRAVRDHDWTPIPKDGSQPRWERDGALGGGPTLTFVSPEIVAAADWDGGRLRFRDAATGDLLGGPMPETGKGLRRAVTAPDGTVWTVDREGSVWRSDVLVPEAACRALGPDDAARAGAGPACAS